MRAWHFVGATLRDGRPVPPDGAWLEHDGPLVLCESGLHASVAVWDALRYAHGATLCRVEMDGEIVQSADKVVARRRRIVARIDATDLLARFARQCARDVIHLWNAPQVVRDYLTTGDDTLRAAAWAAARATARDAARDAARATARDAARDAARAVVGAAQAAQFRALVTAAFAATGYRETDNGDDDARA